MWGRSLMLTAFLAAPCAYADTLDASMTTLLAGRQDPRDGTLYTVVPVYQLVSLVADLHAPYLDELHVTLSGWGEAAFGDPRQGHVTGDLDVAYVDARVLRRRVAVRVGRQLVVGGAARVTQLDGASIEWRIGGGVGLTVYGGVPVTPRFSIGRGDAVGGGRLFWRHRWDTELGLSFIHVEGQGRVARQDGAIDARWAPLPTLTFTGYGLLSFAELRLVEGYVSASWQPIAQLQLAADFRRTSPDLFLPLNSIFAVFAQNRHDEAGGTVFVRLARLRLYGDYHVIVDDSGLGHRGGGKLTVGLGQNSHATVGVEVRVLALPASDGYVQARLFGIERWGAWTVTLDGDAYRMDRAINGQSYSFTSAATIGWDFARGWRTVVTGIADVTPFVAHRGEVLAKLVYNYTLRFHEVRP